MLNRLREAGIPLTVVTEPQIGTSAEHSLVLNVMASFAEFEHDMICGRLADARAALKRQGRRVAGKVPYGYVADPLTKQLQIEPAEADRVRLLFRWAAAGKTAREIANLAIRSGWRTKVGVSRRDGTKRGGGHWTPRQVLETLSNPTYASLVRNGERPTIGCHPAIVPIEQFGQVQRQIESRRTHTSRRSSSAGPWPLQKLLTCGQCQRIMSPSISWHRSIGYRYYRCRSHAGGRPPCRGVCAPAAEIERFVIELLSSEAKRLPGPFGRCWSQFEPLEQLHLLRSVVDRVTFSPTTSTIQISMNEPAMDAIAAGVDQWNHRLPNPR